MRHFVRLGLAADFELDEVIRGVVESGSLSVTDVAAMCERELG